VNFITRAPKLGVDNGWIEAGYGNFNDVRVQGAVEHTFQPDVFGVRVAGTYEHHDGYYHQLNPGQKDPNNLNTMAGRIEARWRPTDWLDTTLKVYGQHDFNRQWADRAKLVDGTKEIPDKPFDVNNTTGSFRTHSAGAQFKARIDLHPNWTLTELASYDSGQLTLDAVDFAGRPTTPTTFGHLLQFQHTHFRQYNEELRANYDGERLHAVAGAYVGRDTVRDNEEYDLVTVIPVSPRFRYDQVRLSEAVFAQIDVDVATNLTLTGGLRYTHDKNEYKNGHADVAVPVVPGGLINTLPGTGTPLCPNLTCPTATEPTQIGKNDALTGRLGLRYTFADGQIVYASFNHGYRSGAYNGIAYLSPAQLFFVRPEKVNSYEVGAKGRFLNNCARLSVAAFYNDYRDQQVIFLESVVTALGPFPVSILDNVPHAHTYGVEFEGSFQATADFRLQGTLGLLDSAYEHGAIVAGQNLTGNRLPYSPRYAGSVGFDWRMGQAAGGDVILDPTIVYSGRYAFDPTGNPNVRTHGYARFNATLSWLKGPYAVRLWTNNLFNEKYNTYGIDVTQNTGNYAFVGAPPRTFGITIARNF
jgi:outer membrane receptor protein involved in Fe transport